MHYCPYCSTAISENAKICHNCNKSLDLDAIALVFETTDDSNINKAVVRKIWLKEHARYIWPAILFFIGFIAGGAILYSIALVGFSSQKEELSDEIQNLKSQITGLNSNAQNAQSGLESQLQAKDQIIAILTEQRLTLSRIINFTRRVSENSLITVNSETEATTFKNNFRYLERQFNTQQEQLNNTAFADKSNFNLETLTQLLAN